ncbi:MAG TPA: hypothetical protein VIX15_01390, partial [Streptosporangiaceae bacterium]
MKTAPARWLPGTGTQPDALIREARRRQRRRYLAVGVAVVAVLGGAAGVAAGLHGPGGRVLNRTHHARSPVAVRPTTPTPPPIPPSVDTTMLFWPAGFGQCCGATAADDLATGRLTQSQEPDISLGDYQPLLTQVGRWLVYVGNGVTAIRDDLSGKPRVLGPTSSFAPSAEPGHVWLFRVRPGTQNQIQAWQVPVAGGAPSPPVTLPAGAYLPAIRGTDAGLLLQLSRGLALWNPGGKPRSLPYSPPGGLSDGFDASARLIAYGTGCTSQVTAPNALFEANAGYDTCQVLRILDVVTGRLTSYAAPPGTAGWVPNGFDIVSAISPGDKMIAAYAATRPQGQGAVRLYLVPIGNPSGPPRAVPSSAAHLHARTAWSANGEWLFYQGSGGNLWAYQVSTGTVRASGTSCCDYS